MAKTTTIKDALAKWQADHPEEKMLEAKTIKLMFCIPPLTKMEPKLNELVACEHLSLATNCIDKINPIPGMKSLRVLSLGRNNLKKIEKLEDVADTLEELWLSYNKIERLDGLTGLNKLRVLYLSNNKIKEWDELLKLRELPALQELLLLGNPMYDGLEPDVYIREVIRRLPKLKKLDGNLISEAVRQAALESGPPL